MLNLNLKIMKKKLFFASAMIAMIVLLSSFIGMKASKEKAAADAAIEASMVEVTFEDGTIAMGYPVTPYLDKKGRTCATINATGEKVSWRVYTKQQVAYSCHCHNCGCGFSTRQHSMFCVTCICCGISISYGYCDNCCAQGCCCGVIFIP